MRYQTSFYMNINNFVKLQNASHRTGISMHDLIIQIMYLYAKDNKKMQIEEGTVKYQRTAASKKWKVFRIALEPNDYELFTDMRKVLKKSVSYLVALAIKKYLDIIVPQILKKLFNYTSIVHDSAVKAVGNIKKWILIWKKPTSQTT